jgi:hypothetical protein
VSDIFQEIEEELRRENFAKLWKRYAPYIIGFLVVAMVGTGIVVGWRQYQAHLRADEGERFQVALNLLHAGKTKEARAAFAGLAQDSARRAVLARFQEAAIEAQQGNMAGAIARYQTIASDDGVDPEFRHLAVILRAQFELGKTDPHRIIARLQPLAAAAGPWQPSALELTALAQLKAGDKKAAHATFQSLADDLAAPRGMRSHAAEMVAALAP